MKLPPIFYRRILIREQKNIFFVTSHWNILSMMLWKTLFEPTSAETMLQCKSKLHHAKRTTNKEQQHSLPWWVWLEKGEKGLVCLSEQKKGWQIRGWGMIVVFKYIKAHREGNHQRETKAIQDGKQDYQKDSQASIDWPLINLAIRGKHGRLRKVLEQFFKVKW